MTTKRNLTLDVILEYIKQLSTEQQQQLLNHLQQRTAGQRGSAPKSLTVEEKKQVLRSLKIDAEVLHAPSPRREDWYSDNGR